MLKKLLPFLTAVLLFNTASPSTLQAAPSFYAGLQGGYNYANIKFDGAHNMGPAFPLYTMSKSSKEHGLQGGFILGGDILVSSKIALGLQLLGDLDTNKIATSFSNHATPQLDVVLQKKHVLIPAATIAYLIQPTLRAFVTIGAGLSQFKIRLYNAEDAIILKKSPSKVGIASSIGLEHHFSPRWSVLGMIGLENYGTVKTRFQDLVDGADDHFDAKLKARYMTAKIGFLLRFGHK